LRLESAACDQGRGREEGPAQVLYHRLPKLREGVAKVSSGLWIILLEAGLALALVAFLVWWTLPRRPENEDRDRH
jgi:hypothetical protein